MSRLMSFAGCIYLAEVDDDGTLAGKWISPGEAYPLSIKITDEIVKMRSRRCDTVGDIIATKSKPSDAGGSLSLHEYTVQNVAKALKGLIATRAVSTSTLTAEPVVLGEFGEYADIGTEDLSSVVVKDATDTTTYTINVDYKLNAVMGLLSPMSGGAIAASATVHVTAAGAANTDERMTIGAGSSKKYAIKGNLIDDMNGDTVKVYLRKVLITSANEINFISDESTEHEQLDFELAPEVPTGQTDYGYIDGLPIGV